MFDEERYALAALHRHERQEAAIVYAVITVLVTAVTLVVVFSLWS